jgi:FKBP-type peptidyl-prolyl cis-trans isomerase
MKGLALTTLILSMGTATTLIAANDSSTSLTNDLDKQSYSAGYIQGQQLNDLNRDLGVKFTMPVFQKGFDDGFSGTKGQLSEEEMRKALVALQQTIFEKQRQFMKTKFEENKKKGESFLKKIKQDNGKEIKELDGGLLYKIHKTGKGASPTLADSVVVNYRGTTTDGQEFDAAQDASLALNSVIKGWQVALQKMHPGDKWTLYIPADMAYGERGSANIMPNSALIFDIELLKVVQQQKTEHKPEQKAEASKATTVVKS